jgi:hypothetical protein
MDKLPNGLTVEMIREMKRQLESVAIKGDITLPMRSDIRLSVAGVVVIPGVGMMHPDSFKDVAGEEAYQYLLTLPRIVTEYD